MSKKIRQKLINVSAFNYLATLLAVNIILLSLAIFFYTGNFRLGYYPLSYIGAYKTEVGGLNNVVSSRIYSIDMALSGLIMLTLSYSLWQKKIKKNWLETMFYTLAGLGFLIASFSPDDTRHTFHVIGSALIFAMLWLIGTKYLLELKNNFGRKKYFALQIILQVPIFTYAATYFLQIDPAAAYIQKIAIFGLIFVLLYSSFYKKTRELF
ncbi:MAG: hypothetical protein ABSE91_00875 [Patescibacteria group bacterium]|jgi:hypothetical protein